MYLFLGFVALVVTFSNFQHPVTPVLMADIGLPGRMYGFLFSFMALGLSLFAPFAGRLVDRIGTRVPMFLGLIAYAISQVLFASTSSVYLLIFFRFTAGISVAFVFPVMITYVSKISKPENRSKAMSYYTGIAIAFMSIGYKLGGFLEQYITAREIFLLQGIMLVVIAFISLFNKNVYNEYEQRERLSLRHIDVDVIKIFFMYFLTSGVFMTAIRFLDVLIIDLGYTPNDTGDLNLAIGAVSLVTTFVLLPYLSRRFKEIKLMTVFLIVAAITLTITFTAFDNIWIGLYTMFLVYNIAKSGYDPMHNSYISKIDEEKQGEMIGISESAKMFGMFVGPISLGYVFDWNYQYFYVLLSIILFIAYIIGRSLNGSTKTSA